MTNLRIHQDHARFRQIVKGRVRRELRKFISRGELIGKQGQKTVSIPLPRDRKSTRLNSSHYS